ncbi:3-isopropylmalate dehydratase small subunit [Bradyrhizobium sp. LHD-71]|uniref:3-isopropylmalate dehydratase small subunit n=1 Tax=Bradyrhizobium sp. LHD-71 TaxID=3072141 RepID=UPI00280FE0EA|nr:3-isopropylmalate dehydratase small subunit [Bradyrhizobium sp. LHD-71]MDQ8729142.1 3-isopropylmalate dehydratase small subunit [Bradyrhizobium sp. LHD-71]
MEPFRVVKGGAAALMQTNINTDVVIRIERLTNADRSKLGRFALEALRYRADGSENPDFPFNQSKYRDAPILIAGRNFGCGSSREGAVWALMGMGLRCVIAESFGDIFYGNCFQNGMLPIRLPDSQIQMLAREAAELSGAFTVDLERSKVTTPSGRTVDFTIDPMRREALLAGLDDIGLTLARSSAIGVWQSADRLARPWVWDTGGRPAR